MSTLLRILLCATLFAAALPSSPLLAQAPPADFAFSASTGGLAPWDEKAAITIDNTGQATYTRYIDAITLLAESTFTVSAPDLQQLWQAVQDSGFFSVSPAWSDTSVRDGAFARIAVTANGTSHQVMIKNVAQPAVQSILGKLNQIIPPHIQLPYSPPQQFDYTPKDPCGDSLGSQESRPELGSRVQGSGNLKQRIFPGPNFLSISRIVSGEASHPGTVVACDVTVQEAVAKGWATLSSKGDYFGDDVSITVRNQNPATCNNISVTLYLEFWGPLATPANIDRICADIARKWVGAKTSDGRPIELGFVTRSSRGATAPPARPGFHQIHLVPQGSARSIVTGGPSANSGTGGGAWEFPGPQGLYAHETGHLMGLPDRYVDFNKQPGGSWVNAATGQSYSNDDAFANYLTTKYPGQSAATIKNNLKNMSVYSVPQDGSENDLMADVSKPLSQADIDWITAHPGLLVTVPKGTVLANRSFWEQNLVVARADEVFAGPGESRTLNGIYAACIDHSDGIPSEGAVLDVAPPLSEWTGIQAAGYLLQLLQYVDSLGLYCASNLATQEAIWRITDNTLPAFSRGVDSLLQFAGINLGDQFLDFPRLTGRETDDSTSRIVVPGELYVAHIRPTIAAGEVGVPSEFSMSLSRPPDSPPPVALSWTATGPDGFSVPINNMDSTASLTPDTTGVYEVAVEYSFDDSIQGQETIQSERRGYVVVPDAYTETFEHGSLTGKYPWKASGDVPWTISMNNPQTGSYAAQPGPVSQGQRSTLAIEVDLPASGYVKFGVRTFTTGFFDGVEFWIDTLFEGQVGGGIDWKFQRYWVPEGRHLLSWIFTANSSSSGSTAWLDNIFFPGNVVVTSVDDAAEAEIPKVFALEQNYPNPFNPTTTIRYALPLRSHATLVIYNTLGQRVAELVNREVDAGFHSVQFDASGLASGVYFYKLTAGSFIDTRKLMVVR